MSDNTIRTVHMFSSEVRSAEDIATADVVSAMNATAAERGMSVDPRDIKALGEVDAPRPKGFEDYEYPEDMKFIGFEAEAK